MLEHAVDDYGIIVDLCARYKKRFKHLDYQELIAEGILTSQEVKKNWEPNKGAKHSTYLYRAVNMDLYKKIVTDGSPVKGNCHQLRDLRATKSLPYDKETYDEIEQWGSCQESVEDAVNRKLIYERLYDHILSQPAGRAAIEVMLDGETVANAASKTGCEPGDVRKATKNARKAIRADDVLADYVRSLL